MTTYAANFTGRARLRYVVCGIEHTIMMRSARGGSAPLDAQIGSIRACFNLFADFLCDDFAFISADYALTDSDIWVARGLPTPVTGEQPIANYSLKQRCTATNFNGRAAGSRAALFFYGILWDEGLGEVGDNGRVTVAELPEVGLVATELSGQAHANSGDQATFHQYANIKLNDHLLKLLRRGTIS